MERYNKIKDLFKNNNCVLLTTYEEYKKILDDKIEYNKKNNKKTSLENIRVSHIAQCGHEHNVAITNFITRKTGILCYLCKNKKNKELNLSKKVQYNNQELLGNNILEKYIGKHYIIKNTKEGCSADILIKEKNSDKNLFIPLQLKTTLKKSKYNTYSFKKIINTYRDMLIICICIVEEKFWVIPFNEIKEMKNLTISEKSKYNKYEIEHKKLVETLKNFSNLETNEENINIPKSNLQKREQLYCKKRASKINFLEYIYPNTQNSRTDFIINSKNIQEKVVGFRKNRNAYSVWLASNNGKKENNKRKFRTYKLGENHYYWFHSSVDDRFWIIPELVLYENNYISNINEIKNRTNIYFKILEDGEYTENKWLKTYEYNYNNIDNVTKDKLIKLFE